MHATVSTGRCSTRPMCGHVWTNWNEVRCDCQGICCGWRRSSPRSRREFVQIELSADPNDNATNTMLEIMDSSTRLRQDILCARLAGRPHQGLVRCQAMGIAHAATATPKTDALSRCGASASPTNNAQSPIHPWRRRLRSLERGKTKVVAGRDADLDYRDTLVLLVDKRVGSMRQADPPHDETSKGVYRHDLCRLAVCHGPGVPQCEERPGAAHFKRDQVCVGTGFCLKSLACLCLLN